MEPAPQRLQRRRLGSERDGEIDKLVDLAAVDSLEQRLARREMAIERADADPGGAGHGLEARIRPAGAEHVARRGKQQVPVSQRIRARFAVCLFELPAPSLLSFPFFACKTEASSV